MPYMVTFTINIPQMLPYMAYMDPMGYILHHITEEYYRKQVSPGAPIENLHIGNFMPRCSMVLEYLTFGPIFWGKCR
jgi:hypothetical protein